MPDAITLITKDHREMEKLFDKLAADRRNRPELVRRLGAMLIAHSRAEEERVYPAIAEEADEKGEIKHSVTEHQQAEKMLHGLERTDPGSAEFDRRLQELVGAIKEHIREEEGRILPGLRQAVGEKRLAELGRAFDERRTQEMSELGAAGPKATATAKASTGTKSTAKGGKPAGTKEELYRQAQKMDISGRSKMTKEELAKALQRAGAR